MPRETLVIGGGLAGIAAATALATAGKRVTLLEARPQLGGRATSYVDATTQERIDNCQHVSMVCCTNLRHLMQTLGLADQFVPAKQLFFIGPHGTTTSFHADPLPAPFHLARAFLRLPYLTFTQKVCFALGVRALARARPESLRGVNFLEWLKSHGQPDEVIQGAWDVILVSALSETLDRVDAFYARKVFVDGFLANADGWQVEIPAITLDELYSERTRAALTALGVDVRTGSRVSQLEIEGDRIARVQLRNEETLTPEDVILAVPQHQIPSLLPDHPRLTGLRNRAEQIEAAPITSVHLWFDRPITELPHAVLVGRCGQWVFNRGETIPAQGTATANSRAFLYQVVISASWSLAGRPQQDVLDLVVNELKEIWPETVAAALLHARMITERRAVFSVTPGIDQLRPPQRTLVPNLYLAGDWTETGWPGTMEGAVRSGYLAAEALLKDQQAAERIVQPNLPVSFWSRLLFGL